MTYRLLLLPLFFFSFTDPQDKLKTLHPPFFFCVSATSRKKSSALSLLRETKTLPRSVEGARFWGRASGSLKPTLPLRTRVFFQSQPPRNTCPCFTSSASNRFPLASEQRNRNKAQQIRETAYAYEMQ